ncbi:hypothetical protein [Psychrosphaera saromensis]|uniref:Uncharacterized protein n=1 Tax=Psychrosphaera saromensis TaxID=716813 RepID=A0A2S7UXB4_9GAMM|nr:hypothetical protein [Psychrosphaera saromensis]PQJ54118.1 hypothetical protein BTO11_10950 [Psychrosphaera saromensis]PQJ54345.1 hypothetical protein BTO11_12215 [Psychrosphaera saromensis]
MSTMRNWLILASLLLVSCTSTNIKKRDAFVTWDEAIVILNSGNVDSAFQAHSLYVELHLKDGSIVKTTSPKIDEILREIRRCGKKCTGISMMLE